MLLDKLVAIASKYASVQDKYSRIILSVCCGRSEAEMRSKDLCICLDVDKRSLFASRFAAHHCYSKNHNVIHHYHNMNDGIYDLSKKISRVTGKKVIILFQHPSPASATRSRNDLSSASFDSIRALADGHVSEITYVYDTNSHARGNCWKGRELLDVALSRCTDHLMESIKITEPKLVCHINSTTFIHPVFGSCERTGWSLLKIGEETYFTLTRPL